MVILCRALFKSGMNDCFSVCYRTIRVALNLENHSKKLLMYKGKSTCYYCNIIKWKSSEP